MFLISLEIMKLFSPILLALLLTLLSSCNSEKQKSQICVGEPGTGTTGTKCHELNDNASSRSPSSSPIPSKSPTIYDVVCFQRKNNLAQTGVACSPEEIFKTARGNKVSASLQTVTSVQQGSNVQRSLHIAGEKETITVAEMESLSTQGSKVYVLGMTIDPSSLLSDKYATQVFYYDQNSGGFQLVAEGTLEKPTEKSSEITFITGKKPTANSNKPNPPSTSLSSPAGAVPPDTLVQNYFTSIKSGQYQKAWDMLPSDLQRNKSTHPNGYKSFTDWWGKTSVDVDIIKMVSQSDREAVVDAEVQYKARKGKPQPLHLRYFLKKKSGTGSWVITKIKS